MAFRNGWGSEKTRKNRTRAMRKSRVRWEVLGLPDARGSGVTPSMEDIRRQVSQMATSGLEQSPDTIEGRTKPANPVPISSRRRRG
jgi:hypothetical protein